MQTSTVQEAGITTLLSVEELHRYVQQCDYIHTLPYDILLASTQHESTLNNMMGKNAPVKTKTITIWSDVEWFDDDIHKARRKQCQL